MNYATIKFNDIANGLGIRTSLFVSGCRHYCKGCFNQEAWDFNYGNPFSKDVQDKIINSLKNDFNDGLSILGGEPFESENQKPLLDFLKRVKEEVPSKNVWCYTGFTLEELLSGNSRASTNYTKELLSLIDVLVDGKFIEEQKNISLKFRGSENQRIIDLKKTTKDNIILYNLD